VPVRCPLFPVPRPLSLCRLSPVPPHRSVMRKPWPASAAPRAGPRAAARGRAAADRWNWVPPARGLQHPFHRRRQVASAPVACESASVPFSAKFLFSAAGRVPIPRERKSCRSRIRDTSERPNSDESATGVRSRAPTSRHPLPATRPRECKNYRSSPAPRRGRSSDRLRKCPPGRRPACRARPQHRAAA
jgi:hypothetical protein